MTEYYFLVNGMLVTIFADSRIEAIETIRDDYKGEAIEFLK